MAQFRKVDIVDARQYSGPALKVISDALGEQTANSGDYLVGTERGKVTVVPKAEFEAHYQPYSSTADDDLIAAQKKQIADLAKQVSDLTAAKNASDASAADAIAKAQKLLNVEAIAAGLQAQVTDLETQLKQAQDKQAATQAQLDGLIAIDKQEADAQAALDAAQSAKQKQL